VLLRVADLTSRKFKKRFPFVKKKLSMAVFANINLSNGFKVQLAFWNIIILNIKKT